MRAAKIHLKGQLAVDRTRASSLVAQIVQQLRAAIEAGRIAHGTRLPSSRSLARALGVSRNTVLAAYEELASLDMIRGRQGAGMFAWVAPVVPSINLRQVIREAMFPSGRGIAVRDQDGNVLRLEEGWRCGIQVQAGAATSTARSREAAAPADA